MPFGKAIEVTRISDAIENRTRLTTNCSVSRMLARVSLGSRGTLLPMPTATTARSLGNTLKNENAAALIAPLASRDVIGAIRARQHGSEQQLIALSGQHLLEVELHGPNLIHRARSEHRCGASRAHLTDPTSNCFADFTRRILLDEMLARNRDFGLLLPAAAEVAQPASQYRAGLGVHKQLW